MRDRGQGGGLLAMTGQRLSIAVNGLVSMGYRRLTLFVGFYALPSSTGSYCIDSD